MRPLAPVTTGSAPKRHPKAPLPPRVSQPDRAEAGVDVDVEVGGPIHVGGSIIPPPPAEILEAFEEASVLEPVAAQIAAIAAIPEAPITPPPFSTERPSARDAANAVSRDFSKAIAELQERRNPAQNGSAIPPIMPIAPIVPAPPSSAPASAAASNRGTVRTRTASLPAVQLGAPVQPTASAPTEPLGSGNGLVGKASPPAPIVLSTQSITAPMGVVVGTGANLNLRPGSAPLAPSRAPSPMAIVGSSSRKLKTPVPTSSVPGAMSTSTPGVALPPSMAAAPVPSDSISVNFASTGEDVFVPPPATYPAPPRADLKTRTPGEASRIGSGKMAERRSSAPPPGAFRSKSPSGHAYERAFRQWSAPPMPNLDEPLPADVTFAVYTAQDIEAGRRPMRSLPEIAPEPRKSSILLRIALGLLGLVIVALTAAAVYAVSTEDAPRAQPAAATPALPTAIAISEPAPVPAPVAIPVVPAAEPADEAPPAVAAPAPVVKKRGRATPSSSGAPHASTAPHGSSAPHALTPPPNPYGK